VLGTHVAQAGSLVADDRLRFDFSHPQAVTAEEQRRIEELVNRWIQADFEVGWRVVSIADAREQGAMMLFGEKYGSEVRMVSVGRGAAAEGQPEQQAVSIELCGGTHVRRTGEIGGLVITTEEAVSAGVRRIIALAGMASVSYHQALRRTTLEAAQSLGAKPGELIERIEKLQADVKAAQRESQQLRDKLAAAQVGAATGSGSGSGSADASVLEEAGGYTYAARGLDGLDASALRNAADTLLQKTKADIVVVGSGKLLAVKVSDAAQERGLHAGNVIRELAKRGGGGGGGRPDMAQAGVADEGRLRDALDAVPEVLRA
jgi:alanyl-tRNA synthetase